MTKLNHRVPGWLALLVAVTIHSGCFGQDRKYSPSIAKASSEGEAAIKTFQIPQGIEAKLFAAEPVIANPVAFTIDHRGRFFVCETFRQQKGVEDNRSHMDWLEDDLAAQTVEDRLAYFKKHLGRKVNSYTREHDRIRLVEDRDGDGVADHESVFADGFNGILDGTGSSVLMRDGNLYYTCIPELWRLRDNDDDGHADERESLSHGYGVRVAFRGHDSHGLIMGPDGRIYFSIGDRGYNIKTKEGEHLVKPYTGAVFRCELDGSNLEVFATGLRNPQELAFDNYGNLFTCDNNSDGGDQARIVYVTQGSDTGWRMYYQYLPDRGPWNREKLWHPEHEGQAAYITPPLMNFADGPSGFAHYPGVGLSPRYDDHFFLCDFRGAAGQSGIRSFALKSNAASFEVVDDHKFIWSLLGTDFEFGYDGKFYISDWVHGWNGLNKGRIYSFEDKKYSQHEAVKQTQRLMASGFAAIDEAQLAQLLSHVDRRVRLESQFELARRNSAEVLNRVAASDADQLARIHAIWGIGQLARRDPKQLKELTARLEDSDPEIVAQAARTIADSSPSAQSIPLLTQQLRHAYPRARFFCAQALAAIGADIPDANKLDVGRQLVTQLRTEETQPVMRHIYSYALSRIFESDQLLRLAGDSEKVQTGIAIALRRQLSPEIAELLNASDAVVLEVARAIHDEPIAAAMPALAGLDVSRFANEEYRQQSQTDPLLRRVINANFIVGTKDCAERVAAIAAANGFDSVIRKEAIWALKNWNEPPNLDRVLGAFRPIARKSKVNIASIIQPKLAMLMNGSADVQKAAIELTGGLGEQGAANSLYEFATDLSADGSVRASAIAALESLGDKRIGATVRRGLNDRSVEVRMQSRTTLARLQSDSIVRHLVSALDNGQTIERQQALAILGSLKSSEATRLLSRWLTRLTDGDAPLAIQLDIIEAAKASGNEQFLETLAAFESTRPDGLAKYAECLEGGDAERGEAIFSARTEVSCRRCHHTQSGFKSVGPNVLDMGKGKDRSYLLESIVFPNKQIAKGFETVVVITDEGLTKTGTVSSETDDILQLMTAEDDVISIRKDEIDERTTGQSAMPADLVKQLSKRDLRDLVEYLTAQKDATEEVHE